MKENGKDLHLLGLVSDGGVHSSLEHLFELLKVFKELGLNNKIYIHAFTDGRDTDSHSGITYIKKLKSFLNELGIGRISTIIGRYYAMDRDNRWERIKLAYDLLVHGKGEIFKSPEEAIESSYKEGITDEFIKPKVIIENGEKGLIKEGDAVLFFNFRADRARQLTMALVEGGTPDEELKPLDLFYVTMTRYNEDFRKPLVLFEKEEIKNTLGEWLSKHGFTQLRIAETEKYPHVTYFFNGGKEEPFAGEDRILVPSPKVATYDLKPEMSAYEVKEEAIKYLVKNKPDFMCLNFANPDMVGHTGVFSAAVRACETVDECLRDVVTTALSLDYVCIVTADHGNADKMINPDGSPNTAHTLAKVPFIIVGKNLPEFRLKEGVLANIAPTILEIMGINKPSEMMQSLFLENYEKVI